MARGRKQKPVEFKLRDGTYRSDRDNALSPDYVSISQLPDPPKYLNEVGKNEYYAVASELLNFGILSRINFSLFVAYCTQVAVYFDAIENISQSSVVIADSANHPKVNPYWRIATESYSAIIRMAQEFGITPASVNKVNANVKKEDPKMKMLNQMMTDV